MSKNSWHMPRGNVWQNKRYSSPSLDDNLGIPTLTIVACGGLTTLNKTQLRILKNLSIGKPHEIVHRCGREELCWQENKKNAVYERIEGVTDLVNYELIKRIGNKIKLTAAGAVIVKSDEFKAVTPDVSHLPGYLGK
jgi:hypothetical protein